MPKKIAIIGGGFSGTALAVQLLQRACRPLEVLLVNRSGPMARGLAYGTRSPGHVLNVPAARMSLFPEREDDFMEYARSLDASAGPGDFLPRSLYGGYLLQRLDDALAAAQPGVVLRHVAAEVLDLQPQVTSSAKRGAMLRLDDGSRDVVEHAVLATGNFAPAVPAALRSVIGHAGFVQDPWRAHALDGISRNDSVLMVGTGLTMYDMVEILESRGHQGPITAISRRGLKPLPHRDNQHVPDFPPLPAALLESASIRQLTRKLRRTVAAYAGEGHDWRDVIAALRPATPKLWQQMPPAERRRFLRHLGPYWEVHRHRAAPVIADHMNSLLAAKRLSIRAGRLLAAEAAVQGLVVAFRPRGSTQTERLPLRHVINCTGPQSDVRRLKEPLFQGLLERGHVQPDEFGLGLRTSDRYALLDREGRASPALFMIGPMLKADYWEATAVPELRLHAQALALQLLSMDHT